MWLLDKNVPVQLTVLLRKLGIEVVTAEANGWGALTNGELVAAAVASSISCILTRDQLFAESAARAIKMYTKLAVVVIVLPQMRAPAFLAAFEHAWLSKPIDPIPGTVLRWPEI